MIELGFGERNEAPVFFPRLIVNFTEPSAFIPKIFEIRWTKSDRAMPLNTSREPSQLLQILIEMQDALGLSRPVTKWNAQIRRADEVASLWGVAESAPDAVGLVLSRLTVASSAITVSP